VQKRIGDRRGRPRFEIVGTLTGTLETLRRLGIRNVGSGGALLETPVPFTPGSRITGRLTFKGHGRDIEARVRHVTTLRDPAEGMRYLVGVEWEASTRVDDLVNVEPLRPSVAGSRQTPERRAGVRVVPGDDMEIGQPNWSTVEVIDISTTGVLFACPVAVEVGEKGKLRMRLGERSFAAHVEIRRTDSRKAPPLAHRLGAAFITLDDGSRMHLEDFIGDVRR